MIFHFQREHTDSFPEPANSSGPCRRAREASPAQAAAQTGSFNAWCRAAPSRSFEATRGRRSASRSDGTKPIEATFRGAGSRCCRSQASLSFGAARVRAPSWKTSNPCPCSICPGPGGSSACGGMEARACCSRRIFKANAPGHHQIAAGSHPRDVGQETLPLGFFGIIGPGRWRQDHTPFSIRCGC